VTTRAVLEHLPEQRERGDHRRSFEVHAHHAVSVFELGRKQARSDDRDDAVDERDSYPEADQREHVEHACLQ
jgi:hypothetical protein